MTARTVMLVDEIDASAVGEVRAYIMSGPVAIGRIGDVSLAALGATPAQACARMAAAGRQLVVNAERAANQWRTTKRTIAMKQALAAIS